MSEIQGIEKKPVVIFGANDLGFAAKEIFDQNEVVTYCYLDDNEDLHREEFLDVSVQGATDDEAMLAMLGPDCNAFVAFDEISLVSTHVEDLKARGVLISNAIHPDAKLATSLHFENGNFINAGAVLCQQVKIGSGNIIHTGALLDIGVQLGDYCQIGQGANVGRGVELGNEVFVGAGVTIVGGVKIGEGARIGAGSVVIKEVKAGQTVFGNPAEPV
jgi:sugar O-acyltransferase (sialic acid O-acetyltransferase NeuD family)